MVLRLSTFPADVRGAVLTGFSTATNAAVVATDTVLAALGKLQAQVSAGGTPAMVKIAEIIVGTATGTVTFASIPATYRHLRLVYQARGDFAGEYVAINGQFNGDTGANYDGQGVFATGSAAVTGFEVQNGTSVIVAYMTGSTAVAGATGAGEITWQNYAGTTFFTTFFSHLWVGGTAAAAQRFDELFGGQWRNTAALNSILLTTSGSGNFVTGSTFTLYGMS